MQESSPSQYQTNEHGVPQYPKGHAGRLLVTLAAIATLERATATTIAKHTGLSKSKIDEYVLQLESQYGVEILRAGAMYRVRSWGEVLRSEGVLNYLTGRFSSDSISQEVPLNETSGIFSTDNSRATEMIIPYERKAILTSLDHRAIDKTLKIIFERLSSNDLPMKTARNALKFLLLSTDEGSSDLVRQWQSGWQKIGDFDECAQAKRKPILSQTDRNGLESMVDNTLDALAAGKLSVRSCVGGFTQVMAAIDIGNHGEVLAWIDNGVAQFKYAS